VNNRPIKNIAASIHQRLLNEARTSGRPFNELLQHYAMERFLYRLSLSEYSDNFVLKGALMFIAWNAPIWRPTRDIDLLGFVDNRIENIISVTKAICLQSVQEDGLVFNPNTVKGENIIETGEYDGVRITFRGNLGSARIPMQIDIGFGDLVYPSTITTQYPTILDFPSPKVRGYSRESVVAEKLEAMVKLGIINSRMKDFFDVWYLAKMYDFAGIDLSSAILSTFSNRETELPLDVKARMTAVAKDSSKNPQWQGFIRNNRLEDAPESFSQVVEAIIEFLEPVINALIKGQIFDVTWRAPGAWVNTSR
jgi:predicted nucleotidyltransferase component of viral defense system